MSESFLDPVPFVYAHFPPVLIGALSLLDLIGSSLPIFPLLILLNVEKLSVGSHFAE